jgi:hypothetical protein
MGALRERIWFLSPALATGLFFAAQAYVSLSTPAHGTNIEGAAAETPNPTNVKVRVVEQIRPLSQMRATKPVPMTEQELLELFARDGAVVFFQDEVEVVETSEKEFEAEVITLRKARLVRD